MLWPLGRPAVRLPKNRQVHGSKGSTMVGREGIEPPTVGLRATPAPGIAFEGRNRARAAGPSGWRILRHRSRSLRAVSIKAHLGKPRAAKPRVLASPRRLSPHEDLETAGPPKGTRTRASEAKREPGAPIESGKRPEREEDPVSRLIALTVVVVILMVPVITLAGDSTVPLSPGGTDHSSVVEGLCPTFSWTAAVDAEAYELLIYELTADSPGADPALRARGAARGSDNDRAGGPV